MKKVGFGIIGGCGSSGTTLLISLLGRHPNVLVGPELNLLNHEEIYDYNMLRTSFDKMSKNKAKSPGYFFTNWFLTERSYYNIGGIDVKKWVDESKDSYSFIMKIIRHILKESDKTYFVEKTPSNIYFFSRVLKIFKDVPVVHMVRDGRDVVTSLIKRGFSLFGAGSRWVFDTACGVSNRDSKNYLEIKYEELVTKPEETLRCVFEHLGIKSAGPNVTDLSSGSKGFDRMEWKKHEVGRLWNRKPTDPISSELIGRYKRFLSRRDLEILNRITLRTKIIKELKLPVASFKELISFLNYDEGNDNRFEEKMPWIKLRLMESQDYVRRMKGCVHMRYWSLPRRVTYLSR